MKKAFFLLPTLLIGITSWSLPMLNILPGPKAGKFIKAGGITHWETVVPTLADSLLPVIQLLQRGNYEVKTVVIDPGHGGHDPGCLGARSKEKHHCLAIGKYFAEALKQNYPELNVIMTRSTDVFIPLNERAAIATRNKADLFVSIHCNFIPKASHVHGTETYVLGLHATKENLDVAKRENASILLEDNYQETYGYDPNSTEAHILLSMFQNAFLEQSISFAQKVQQYASSHSSRRDKGVKQAGFLVLRYATMPSVLVETGYLSNSNEEDYLRSDEGQRSMANSLLMAFADYKSEMEGREAAQLAILEERKSEQVQKEEATGQHAPPTVPSRTDEVAMALPVKAEQPSAPLNPGPADASPSKIIPPKKNEVAKAHDTAANTTIIRPKEKPGPAKTNESPAAAAKILPSTPLITSPAEPLPAMSEVQFRVQLAASPQLLDVTEGKWMKVPYLIEVVEESKLYKYQVRNFANLDDANLAKDKLRSVGFNDAFVVAYQNGKRVDPKNIAK